MHLVQFSIDSMHFLQKEFSFSTKKYSSTKQLFAQLFLAVLNFKVEVQISQVFAKLQFKQLETKHGQH